MIDRLLRLFKTTKPEDTPLADPLEARRAAFRKGVREALDKAHTVAQQTGKPTRASFPLQPYVPPKGVVPEALASGLAMDVSWKNLAEDSIGSFYGSHGMTASVLDGMGFPGFPYLTELTQLTEYRDMSERTAAEMTRKWIKLRSTGDDDKTDIIEKIDAAMRRYHIRELFRQAAVLDGFMGRSQIYIDMMEADNEELQTPLMLNIYKVRKDSLKGFKIVEPITTYPANYNSSNPLAGDYYIPSAWFVYGQKVHASRLITFISRPLPDLLKPVFNFSGISLSQLAQPYVDYWFSTRDSVGNLLRNFSTTWLKSDLDILLSPGGDDLMKRVELFTRMRDNQGIFLLNKDSEELGQFNTPLSGLDHLQAQAQEHMAAVAKTPLVILLGITPTGLNATAEGDLHVYYDYIADQQENIFRVNLEQVIKVIMLSELGYIDEEITFDFEPLFALTGKETALIRKSDGDSDVAYITAGVLTPEEVRTRIASNPDSGYDNIDVSKVPAPPVPAGPPAAGGKPGAPPPIGANGKKMGPQSQAAAGLKNELAGQAQFTAEENTSEDSIAKLATDIMTAVDGGFRGNQHLGGFKNEDNPHSTAMRLSAAATAASREAGKQGTGRSHTAALNAHSRAFEAHQRALALADPAMKHAHEAYCEAHKAACDLHRAGKDCVTA